MTRPEMEGGQTAARAGAENSLQTGAGYFPFQQWKADQINALEATELLTALRHKDAAGNWEGVWLQTFADAPDDCYSLDQRTSKTGRPYTVRRWCLTDVPKEGGKVGKVQGVAEAYGNVSMVEFAAEPPPYARANLARVGVFFAVNVLQPDAPRRKAEHVARVAAVFLDLDGAPMPTSFPLEPTATVESSSGRHHAYWAVSDLPLEEFSTIQKTLAALYGADPVVHDLVRVMRLPGYYHGKKDTGFLVRLTSCSPENQYTRADLLAAWPELEKALADAEAEREAQRADAEQRRAAADELRQQIESGTAGTRAEVQQKYGRVGLLGLCADLLAAPVGQRNATLNAVAYRAGRLVGAGVLEEAEAVAELREVAERVGLEAGEITSTLSSGLEAGKLEPIDAGKVGQFVGVKKAKKEPEVNPALVELAEAVADQQKQLPAADEIPDPTGEGGSYSDQQVIELLGITWPVTAAHTDLAHAHRLYELAGDDLAFVPALGGYVGWNKQQWLAGGGKDSEGKTEAKSRAQGIGRAMQPEVDHLLALYGVLAREAARIEAQRSKDAPEAVAARNKAEAMRKAYHRHHKAAAATEQAVTQANILKEAGPLYRRLNPKTARDFEPQPWRVGFPNGVWDRGEFRPARREDHMLTLAAVEYQPDADRSDWYEVRDRITGGDTDLQRTLQDVAGYILSGASSLRTVPWAYGPAGTGKSTYAELLASVLGELAVTVSPKHLASDADRERLGAVVWGRYLALLAEAGNQRLDAESIKTLSGGDRLPVRKLYAESFTGRASHVLLMVANDPPRVEAYDDALKDRVLALPFTHPLREGGPLLGGRRLEEVRQDTSSPLLLGFTAWAVEGLARVYATGDIHRAAVCRAATRAFWEEVDPLRDFWRTLSPSRLAVSGVLVDTMRSAYEEWAKSSGVRPMTAHKFNKAARSVGLDQKTSGGVRSWKLVSRDRFPGAAGADQPGAGETCNGKTENDSISQNPSKEPPREGEEKHFTENGSKSVFPLQGQAVSWEGEQW